MNQKLVEFNRNLRTKNQPVIKPGDIVRVHKKIKEGERERIQVFKGLVIAIKGKQSSSPTITVRRESQGLGVEMTLPIFLPTIEKIEVLRHSKVRRAKLYYMRGRSGKSAKMKVKELNEQEKAAKIEGQKNDVISAETREEKKEKEVEAKIKEISEDLAKESIEKKVTEKS